MMSLSRSLLQRAWISLKLPGNISASAQSDDLHQACTAPTFLQRQLSYLNTVQDYFNTVQLCCLHIELEGSKVPLTKNVTHGSVNEA